LATAARLDDGQGRVGDEERSAAEPDAPPTAKRGRTGKPQKAIRALQKPRRAIQNAFARLKAAATKAKPRSRRREGGRRGVKRDDGTIEERSFVAALLWMTAKRRVCAIATVEAEPDDEGETPA